MGVLGLGVLLRAIYNHNIILIQLLLTGGSTEPTPKDGTQTLRLRNSALAFDSNLFRRIMRLNKDYDKDPKIKALNKRGLTDHGYIVRYSKGLFLAGCMPQLPKPALFGGSWGLSK